MRKLEKSKSKELGKTASILKSGGIVIFPTDTVYGIGCRFDDKKALNRLYEIKGTPKSQQFPILVSNLDQVRKIAKINRLAKRLMASYWPGALTIILSGKDHNNYGFRMPDSALVKFLIDELKTPIIGTSANFHGQNTPKTYGELDKELRKLVDYTIKGDCKTQLESTVIDVTVNPPKILRKGAVIISDFKN